AARADLAERLRPVAVAGGRDGDERDLDPGGAQPPRGRLRLDQREPTAAGADANQHDSEIARASSGRSSGCPWAGSARTRSAPGPGAASRSAHASCSPLVLETEEVPHGV